MGKGVESPVAVGTLPTPQLQGLINMLLLRRRRSFGVSPGWAGGSLVEGRGRRRDSRSRYAPVYRLWMVHSPLEKKKN